MINVLSLFDGISCCHLALDRAGISVDKYYAAEIDKYAITVTQANYPDTIQMGSVTEWQDWDINWSSIDLVTGGFPCQSWSVAGKQMGDKDDRGALFWTMLDIMQKVLRANPRAKFLMENVKMKREFEQYITHHTEAALGKVYKTLINSSLLSAQNRQRYYWTNWIVTQPEDKGIVLADILETEVDPVFISQPHKDYDGGNQLNPHYKSQANTVHEVFKKSPTICAGTHGYALGHIKYNPAAIVGRRLNERGVRDDYNKDVPITQCLQVKHNNEKMGCLTTVQKDTVISPMKPGRYPLIVQKGRGNNAGGLRALDGKTPSMTACSWQDNNHVTNGIAYRKLTPVECERLQTVPDNYTAHVSNTQRYKCLGNGWTVDVIAHIFSHIEAKMVLVEKQLDLFEGAA